MKEYEIVHMGEIVNWDIVPCIAVSECLWNTKTDIKMQVQVCYNEDALYIRMTAKEKNIRAEYSAPLSRVCQDSCMEFFFAPIENDKRYINFEINPNCCTFIGISTSREDNTRICPAKEDTIFLKSSQKIHDGWEVNYRIPASFVRVFFPEFHLHSGAIIRANFYKCGDLTEKPHYISWNPVTSAEPDFHRSQDFGKLILI